jgi:hypothetical protein
MPGFKTLFACQKQKKQLILFLKFLKSFLLKKDTAWLIKSEEAQNQ